MHSLFSIQAGLLLFSACAVAQSGRPLIALGPNDTADEVVAKAASVVPTARQTASLQHEFAAFIHFGMNTFTDREWGDGKEDEKTFNPTALDAGQWVAACKSAGITLLILTAKHHDGFCLWPSKFTEHSVKNSPWKEGKGDVVREAADACRAGGIAFGIYLSPWDRHEKTYGDSEKYNAYYKSQLRELLSNYGEIADVWMDGACGEGENGKKQVYDFPAYFAVVRELQPNATISICGPDIRWCGNEAGECREAEWSVVPVTVGAGAPGVPDTSPLSCDAMAKDLGSRDALMKAAKAGASLAWYPSQVDTSIRPGWFYHAKEDGKVKKLDHLLDIYYGSVGGNAQLLLNLPPDRRGLIHENDAARLKELGAVLQNTFAVDLAEGALATPSDATACLDINPETYWTGRQAVLELKAPAKINRALLQEFVKKGQRVEAFTLEAWSGEDNAKGEWKPMAAGKTIGGKRLLRFPDTKTSRVRLTITESRGECMISKIGLFHDGHN